MDIECNTENIEIYVYRGIRIELINCEIERVKNIKEYITNSLDLIPEDMISALIADEFEIIVLDGKYIKGQHYLIAFPDMPENEFKKAVEKIKDREINGSFLWGRPYVFITEHCPDCDNKYVLLHEIGHFLDSLLPRNLSYEENKKYEEDANKKDLYKSYNNRFNDIYKHEKKYFPFRSHYRKSFSEYFAQSFALCIIKNEEWSRKCHKTNDYMKEFINTYSK